MTTIPVTTRPQPFTNAANRKDVERIGRALARLGVWECPCCLELYPKPELHHEHTQRPFGICLECFENNEDCDQYTKLPGCDHDTYVLYSKLLKGADIHNHFGRNPHHDKRAPVEFEMLCFLVESVGIPKMRSIVAKHRPHLNAPYNGGQPRAFVDTTSLRWSVGYGYAPVGVCPLPLTEDHKAWERLRTQVWQLDLDALAV